MSEQEKMNLIANKGDCSLPSLIEFRLAAAWMLGEVENYESSDCDDLYHANCAQRVAKWMHDRVS